jgi:hypothetical protein
VEEALRLMAVKRDAGRIQVQHDLLRPGRVRLQKQLPQQPVQGFGRVADLVITTRAANQFQPVQRALASQRLIQFPLAAQQRQQRVRAQLMVLSR